MNLNDKIKELEESIITKDNTLEVVNQELEEEREISSKALELINEKEEEIENLKKKSQVKAEGGEKKKRKSVVEMGDGKLTPEEVQALKELFITQQEEYDEYKEATEQKIKIFNEDHTKLLEEISELRDKNSNLENEIFRLKELMDKLEKEKTDNEKIFEEIKEDVDIKDNYYINEIQIVQKQLEESKTRNELQRKKSKSERNQYETIINDLKKNCKFRIRIKRYKK